MLYQNGIGYFERSGSVQGSFDLPLAEHEIDNVMKTLTVVGADGASENPTVSCPSSAAS